MMMRYSYYFASIYPFCFVMIVVCLVPQQQAVTWQPKELQADSLEGLNVPENKTFQSNNKQMLHEVMTHTHSIS